MPAGTSPKPRLRIGFVHRFDARNIRSWSGTFYFMAEALQNHVGDVVFLGPDTSAPTKFMINNGARINRMWKRFTGKILVTDHNRILSMALARFFGRRLKEQACDVIFAPVASVEIARLKTKLPIVYCSDITWNAIVDYYPEFSSVSSFGRAEGERIESAAIERAQAAVYPSKWAADSACNHYGSSPRTTFQFSLGANLNEPPPRSIALNRTMTGGVNLLMIGVDWERKGGPIAHECFTTLLERGFDARLTVVGCVPPSKFDHPGMRVIPFLSKNDPEQRKQIAQFFTDSHFLLFPTRAEGLGVVTCEASAFGLPTLASDTGGVRGSLNDGVNGFLMPFHAPGKAYADRICDVLVEPGSYAKLAVSSRDEYERSLNWDAWGKSMRGVMEQVLGYHLSNEDLPSDFRDFERFPVRSATSVDLNRPISAEVVSS